MAIQQNQQTKIRAIRPFYLAGGVLLEAGKTALVSRAFAREMQAANKAEEVYEQAQEIQPQHAAQLRNAK
jgi:hypothetical protein